jgi:hypothetical protein
MAKDMAKDKAKKGDWPKGDRDRALDVSRDLRDRPEAAEIRRRTAHGEIVLRKIAFVAETSDTPAHVEILTTGTAATRWRVFNPPTLVRDPAGPVVRETAVLADQGRRRVERYRYDPLGAVSALMGSVAADGGSGRRRRPDREAKNK